MHRHAVYALAHPVYDPERQIVTGHYWRTDEDVNVSAGLTVNIGDE